MNIVEGQNLVVLVVAALIFFGLGSLAGWLVSQLRTDSPEKKDQPAATDTPQAGEPIPPPSPGVPEKIELARIYRQRSEREIVLEANGRALKTPADVSDAERSWLVTVAKVVNLLLEAKAPGEPTTGGVPGQSTAGQIQPPTASLPPLNWQPSPPPQFQKPSMNPADILIRAVQASQVKIDHTKSLAGQIDEVLQEMLEASPLPVGEIHLADNAALGLEVSVGGVKYEGIDAVPDNSVRQVIRAAVAEWQLRSQRR